MESEGDQAGWGERLRRAREARGLSRADLSEELRLTQDKIRALEEEDSSRLPENAFVRGYLRNYAKAVGVEPDEVLRAFPGGAGEPTPGPENGSRVLPEPERPWIEHPWRVVWASLTLLLAVSVATLWLVGESRRTELPGSETFEERENGSQEGPEATASNGTQAEDPAGTEEFRPSGTAAPADESKAASGRFAEADSSPPERGASRTPDASEGASTDPAPSVPEPDRATSAEEDPIGADDRAPSEDPEAEPGASPSLAPPGETVVAEVSPDQETEAAEVPSGGATEYSGEEPGSEPSVLSGPSLESDFLADLPDSEASQAATGETDGAQGEGPALPEDLQVLRIRTWAKSWMEVEDARERLLLRRLVPAQQELRLYGEPPFRLKVGNAAGVQLYFQGEPLAPLGDPGQVVELTVDEGSATVPESEVGPPAGLDAGASSSDSAAGSQLSKALNPPTAGRP